MPPRISLPLALLAGVLATASLAGPAAADAPGDTDAAPRFAPRRLVHRPPPAGIDRERVDRPYAGRPLYGPVVRAYLPRNNNVPMYNEPPAR